MWESFWKVLLFLFLKGSFFTKIQKASTYLKATTPYSAPAIDRKQSSAAIIELLSSDQQKVEWRTVRVFDLEKELAMAQVCQKVHFHVCHAQLEDSTVLILKTTRIKYTKYYQQGIFQLTATHMYGVVISCVVGLPFTRQLDLLQWLLPICRYKHGSLECSKIFTAPPCSPFSHVLKDWTPVDFS